MEDPEKIFLANTNQLFAFGTRDPNIGTLREIFFLSSLRPVHSLAVARNTDFLVDQKFFFEVGGKNKTSAQIKNLQQSYLALDDIEQGYKERIPLWLFGFLY